MRQIHWFDVDTHPIDDTLDCEDIFVFNGFTVSKGTPCDGVLFREGDTEYEHYMVLETITHWAWGDWPLAPGQGGYGHNVVGYTENYTPTMIQRRLAE